MKAIRILNSEMRTTEYTEYTEDQRVGAMTPLTLGMRDPIWIIYSFSVCSVCSVVCHLPIQVDPSAAA